MHTTSSQKRPNNIIPSDSRITEQFKSPEEDMDIQDVDSRHEHPLHESHTLLRFTPHEVHLVELIQKFMRLRLKNEELEAKMDISPHCGSGHDEFMVPSSAGSVDFIARKLSGDSSFTEMAMRSGAPVVTRTQQHIEVPRVTDDSSSSSGSSPSGSMFASRKRTQSSASKPQAPAPQRKMRKRALTIDTVGSQPANTQAPVQNRVKRTSFECGGFTITREGVVHFPAFLMPCIQRNHIYNPRTKLPTSSSRLDEFKGIRTLGEGRSSRVSLVSDEQSDKLFARKTIFLSPEIPDYMVCRELTAMILCNASAHIVQFVDAFYDGFCVHILTEYIEGDVLSTHTAVDEQVARAIIFQALLAMDVVHSSRVLHMDIKLGNMILTPQGVVVLYDFGLSLYLPENAEYFDRKFSSDGTLAYMSPEKMQNQSFRFQSDIWSLGVATLRLVSGFLPQTNMDQYYASMDNIISIPNQLDNILERVHPTQAFVDFVRECLQVEQDKRPSTKDLLHNSWFEGLQEDTSEAMLRAFFHDFHKDDPEPTQLDENPTTGPRTE